MGEVIGLPRGNGAGDEGPHIQGPWVCLACHHRYHAVAPVGTFEGECPSCHAWKSVPAAFTVPASRERWVCNCGCDLFRVDRAEVFCANCGAEQRF